MKQVFTDEEIEKFREYPLRNPKTGRKISLNGKIYNQLKLELIKKDEIENLKNINIAPKLIVKKLKPKGVCDATSTIILDISESNFQK